MEMLFVCCWLCLVQCIWLCVYRVRPEEGADDGDPRGPGTQFPVPAAASPGRAV